MLLLISLLILHLLANELIHIVHTCTHSTICSIILGHEISTLLAVPGLKTAIA
jgi:hypothetical protein